MRRRERGPGACRVAMKDDPTSPPESLEALVARFDPSVFDAPRGSARIRLVVKGRGRWDAEVRGKRAELRPAREERRPDAEITADARSWREVSAELASGLDAHRAGRLVVRRDMHLGVGFLAATSGAQDEGRLKFARVRTRNGRIATMEAGVGRPVVMLHGLGGTKISFLPTVAALAPDRRAIAIDLPGFGDSDKPLASYDAAFFARWVVGLLDALRIDRADGIGHSIGRRRSAGGDAPWAWRHEDLVPPDGRRSRARSAGDRDRPPRFRRLRQAARVVRRRLLRTLGRGPAGRPAHRPGRRDRPQHGRPG